TSGGGPKGQETMGDIIAQTRFENVSKTSNDPLFARGNTLQSGEDSLKLKELMKLCTNLQQRVIDLETTKTTQANEIASLSEENASKQGRRVNAIDADEDITLVNDQDDADMFGVNDLDGDEVIVDNASITDVEVTLAQALVELKSAKPKANKVMIQEPEQGTTTTTPTTIISVPKPPQDKGKWIMIEVPVVEQVKPMKRIEQIRLDEELAFKLQAEDEEEERLTREKAQQTEEANIAWDDVQAKIEADYQLAQRLQAQEQEELTDEEKARLFVQFLEQRRKHFAAKRAEEKRNRPPTRAQQRSIMCTYLKNIETPPKCDTQRNTTIGVLLHNTCTRVQVNVQRYVYKIQFHLLERSELHRSQYQRRKFISKSHNTTLFPKHLFSLRHYFTEAPSLISAFRPIQAVNSNLPEIHA
ncbi:hypothetical protein Tco_1534389, partial [Tanacetum coccineum]